MTAEWERKLRRAAVNLENAHTARDRTIREAAAAGMTQQAIADAVGLSRVHVYRLLRDAKQGG